MTRTGPIRRVSLGGLNCQVLRRPRPQDVGVPPVIADATVNIFAAIGACNK